MGSFLLVELSSYRTADCYGSQAILVVVLARNLNLNAMLALSRRASPGNSLFSSFRIDDDD
jgi:hypothetical protein